MASHHFAKEPEAFHELIGKDNFSWFVQACKDSGALSNHKPDEIIWNQRQKIPIGFRLVMYGCVAVWDNTFQENSIDALILPGQVVGDFELFGYKSDNFELRTLSDCTIAHATPEIVEALRGRLGDAKFYQVLSELFIGKLLFQNKLVKWRFRGLKRRLAKFIDAFVHEKMWRQVTSIGDKVPFDSNRIEKFLINLTFDIETFKCILTCDGRGIEPLLGRWVKEEIIEVQLYNKEFKFVGTAGLTSMKDLNIPPDTPFFKISILDYRELRAAVDLY